MKHSERTRSAVQGVLNWLNVSISKQQWAQIESLADWLVREGIRAGGLGPGEGDRIWQRHVADSLAFAYGWVHEPPKRIVDVGSGVGLPGTVLAVLWPDTEVTLLDRSERRADLARRAVRVVGVQNAVVRRAEVEDEVETWPAATMRAVAAPKRAMRITDQVLTEEGTAVIGLRGDHRAAPPAPPGRTVSILEVPETVLDGAVSLLIMGPRGY